MSLDNSSLLIGAVVGVGAAIALTSKKGGSGKSTARKGKGLGATYVVSGTSRKVTGKRATAARKAAGTTAKRKAAPKAKTGAKRTTKHTTKRK